METLIGITNQMQNKPKEQTEKQKDQPGTPDQPGRPNKPGKPDKHNPGPSENVPYIGDPLPKEKGTEETSNPVEHDGNPDGQSS